jgi:hypothetical protein
LFDPFESPLPFGYFFEGSPTLDSAHSYAAGAKDNAPSEKFKVSITPKISNQKGCATRR